MRWIWIDKFTEFTPRTSASTLKNVSLAEEHLHDLYPDFPIVPHSLIVEGFAQTAGILVGEARNFEEKVILAKVAKATFYRLVRPGDTIQFHAKVDQLSEQGAATHGTVTCGDDTVADPLHRGRAQFRLDTADIARRRPGGAGREQRCE